MKTDLLDGVKRILVYKRTHNGDPNEYGEFGCNDCMKTVRDRDFDAVIGVGGISGEPQSYGINGKINWIGIRPLETQEEYNARMKRRGTKYAERKMKVDGRWRSNARVVLFEHFMPFKECGNVLPKYDRERFFVHAPAGPEFKDQAPRLAQTLLRNSRHPRMLTADNGEEFHEARRILAIAQHAPPSPGLKSPARDSRATGRKRMKC